MARTTPALDPSDAFELFLDTACNAFGGIVFILLLVCIMLQLSGAAGLLLPGNAPPDPVTEARRKDLEAERSRLLTLQDAQAAQLRSLASEGDAAEHARLRQREAEASRLTQTSLAEADRLAAETATLEQRLEPERAELTALRGRLDEAARRVQEASGLPGEAFRGTNRTQVPLLLSAGRLSPVYQFDRQGKPVDFDRREVEVAESGEGSRKRTLCRPRPGTGIAVDDTPAFDAALKELLGPFRGETHFVAVVVWPDSYPQFVVLQRKLAAMKLGYFLLLQRQGESVAVSQAAVMRQSP